MIWRAQRKKGRRNVVASSAYHAREETPQWPDRGANEDKERLLGWFKKNAKKGQTDNFHRRARKYPREKFEPPALVAGSAKVGKK